MGGCGGLAGGDGETFLRWGHQRLLASKEETALFKNTFQKPLFSFTACGCSRCTGQRCRRSVRSERAVPGCLSPARGAPVPHPVGPPRPRSPDRAAGCGSGPAGCQAQMVVFFFFKKSMSAVSSFCSGD